MSAAVESPRSAMTRCIDYAVSHAWVSLLVAAFWVGGVYAVYAGGMQAVAARTASLTPMAVERWIGRQWAKELRKYEFVQVEQSDGPTTSRQASDSAVTDPARLGRLAKATQQLADAAGVGQVRVYFVHDQRSPNAFAIPGGHVAFTQGLLDLLSDQELAAVAAHEVAHLKLRHSLQRVYNHGLLQTVLSVAAGNAGGASAQYGRDLAARLGTTAFSRDDERQADLVGVQLLVATGRDPMAFVGAMNTLSARFGRDSSGTQWLSTHPGFDERIEAARDAAEVSTGSKRATSSAEAETRK